MTPELTQQLARHLQRAWSGAVLCRDRHLALLDSAPVHDVGAFAPVTNLVGMEFHDPDYFAWEAGRIIKIAEKARSAGLNPAAIETALDALTDAAPSLTMYRNSATHPEDNRKLDDVGIDAAATRLTAGGVEYILDIRHERLHDALKSVVEAADAGLRK